jgi:ubiquinone/menaquinone biosynthesis C-methylase UbiE
VAPLPPLVFCAIIDVSQYSLTQARKVHRERSKSVLKKMSQVLKKNQRLLSKDLFMKKNDWTKSGECANKLT